MRRPVTIRSKSDIIKFVNTNPSRKGSALLVFVALGGIFIDAYDFTSIGIGSQQLVDQFNLTSSGLGIVTAMMGVGAFVGALVGGYFTDKFGRNLMFLIDLLLFVVTAAGAAFAPNYIWLLIFRFFMGAGVGLDMPVALSFITEFSNIKTKGKYVNFWQPFWYIATVSTGVVALIAFSMGVGEDLWRWAVGFGGVFALIVLILRLIYMNESPMWAANNLPLKDAVKVLEKTYKIPVAIDTNSIETEIKNTRHSYSLIFSKRFRKRSILSMIISATQSMQYFAIGFYIPVISTIIFGKGMVHGITGTIVINLFGIIGGFTGAYLTAKHGTRKLAIFGYFVVIASLLFIGLTFGHIPIWLAVIPLATFIFGHSTGPGSQGKTMAALSYPTSHRALGTGAAEAASRVGSVFGFYFFPVVLGLAGLANTMLILILCPLIGLIAALTIKWEPSGLDIENEEDGPSGVQTSTLTV